MDKKKTFRISLKTLLIIIGIPVYLWCLIALYFIPFVMPWIWLRVLLIVLMGAGIPLALILFKSNKYSLISSYAVFLLVIIVYSFKSPSNDRDWALSVAKLPRIDFKDNLVIVRNVRNFKYRSVEDFDAIYYDKIYDINKLKSLDLILSYWDGKTSVAHAIFSFGFENGDYLAVSNEVRLTKGEKMSLLGGIFNEYEIIYILSDENDVIKLRTNYRKEDVYLYRVKPKRGIEDIKAYFIYLMKKIDSLEENPKFYNTLATNCLTSQLHDFQSACNRQIRFDIRLIKNGYFDQLMYERGALQTWGLTFPELKKQRYINQYVTEDSSNFSRKIRTPPEPNNNNEKNDRPNK